jgi:choline dehydrogenase-like flavoprotein
VLLDGRQLENDGTVTADVCVVGSGPAGATIARELARAGIDVCVVESGGHEPDHATQALAAGETSGDCFKELISTRQRQLGGTARLWDTRLSDGKEGFRGAPLDPIDFEKREWVPYSGWPFTRAHLDPFYARAQSVCGMGRYEYRAEGWEGPDARRLPFDGDMLGTGILQFGSQQLFVSDYPAELARSGSVTVLTHSNAVEVETNESGGIATRLRVKCLSGTEFTVAARYFVIAAGGLENARLLLLSDRVQRGGLGNQHDVVGRYFMEHQYIRTGMLSVKDRGIFDRAILYDERSVDGAVVMGNLRPSAAAMRRERLLYSSLALIPQHASYRRFRQEAVDSFSELVSGVLHLRLPDRAGEHFREVVSHLDYITVAALRKVSGQRLFRYRGRGAGLLDGGGWSSLPDKARRFSVFDVILHAEQAPHPDNRVTLSEQRDALGCRRAHLHWQWRDQDVDSVLRTHALMAAEIKRSGIGTLHVDVQDGRPNLLLPGLHHHMGTTRMHTDPRQGVVDPQGRVHGVANLFVAGCSTFPTGGYINPTLTIVALGIRQADHLRQRLEAREPNELAASAGARGA